MTDGDGASVDSRSGEEAIKDATSLDGDPAKVREFYDDWAEKYDRDVADEEYSGPEYIVEFFSTRLRESAQQVDPQDRHLEILDAGCGTGLIGVALKARGYQTIDGFDLAPSMVAKAGKTGAYRSLRSGVDMTRKMGAYGDGCYDAVVCCGVFTHGHVPPSSLLELARVAEPGGWLVVSTRVSYCDATGFESVCRSLAEEGRLRIASAAMNGPYTADEGAHYWAFEVC